MDRGIRQGVNAKFAELLPQLSVLGGKTFRRTILDHAVEAFGVTMASASTHYNFALHEAKKADAALVLGRSPEKNNGGRKKGSTKAVTPSALLANFVKAGTVIPAVAKVVASQSEVAASDEKALEEAAATLYTVKRKDGTIVAEGVSQEVADELVAKAKAAKKGALIIA